MRQNCRGMSIFVKYAGLEGKYLQYMGYLSVSQGQLLLINSNKDIWKELTEILKKYQSEII